MPSGPAERRVRVLLIRYAAWVRAVAGVACVLLGTLIVPGDHRRVAVTAMLALSVWTIWYAVRLTRRPQRLLVVGDVLLLGLAALAQQWTVPDRAGADSTGWVLAVLTVASVTLQWYTEVTAGALAVAALAGAYLGGAFWAVGPAELDRLGMLIWLVPQAALSRAGRMLLLAAARRTDALEAGRESERVTAAVHAARRADERDQQALLHDTVATTLLMVGVGAVPPRAGWLAEQAGRDLDVLRQAAGPVPLDLGELLLAEIARSPVPVEHGPFPGVHLPAPVAAAVAGCVREALTNVHRHAGAGSARVTAAVDPLRVTVADDGRGFCPADARAAHHRGITVSIVDRVAAAGGRATVRSAPGRGTEITCEWPDE